MGDWRKYKSYSKARIDTFYIVWIIVALIIVAVFINDVLLAKEGNEANLEKIGVYLILTVSLAVIARIDFLFCRVIGYYANVTCHIYRLQAKIERMAAKQNSAH